MRTFKHLQPEVATLSQGMPRRVGSPVWFVPVEGGGALVQ